jgi:hypothetical protein
VPAVTWVALALDVLPVPAALEEVVLRLKGFGEEVGKITK